MTEDESIHSYVADSCTPETYKQTITYTLTHLACKSPELASYYIISWMFLCKEYKTEFLKGETRIKPSNSRSGNNSSSSNSSHHHSGVNFEMGKELHPASPIAT